MSSLKDNKSCVLLEQYLSYLTIIKERSPLTAAIVKALLKDGRVALKGLFSEHTVCVKKFADRFGIGNNALLYSGRMVAESSKFSVLLGSVLSSFYLLLKNFCETALRRKLRQI